ncbi:MAG: endo-1,4-beta-xylanase, partial [Kiritimatiellaeota bacterium]|nr:endo-1,4-beta-xylanase [Kiritimatiellota bacterium]
ICRELGRVGIVREVFAAARECDPGSCLLINDYDLSPEYGNLIGECLDAGIKIDAIGLQTHQHKTYLGRERLEEILSYFEKFGLPLHFTENTIVSGDLMPDWANHGDYYPDSWQSVPEGEERQAEQLAEMYSLLFAHPLVEAVTNWESADGGWLNAPAGFLRKDNGEKPVYRALMKLIHGDWKTNAALLTDACGCAELRGFRGEYEAEFNGAKTRFTLGKNTKNLTITL